MIQEFQSIWKTPLYLLAWIARKKISFDMILCVRYNKKLACYQNLAGTMKDLGKHRDRERYLLLFCGGKWSDRTKKNQVGQCLRFLSNNSICLTFNEEIHLQTISRKYIINPAHKIFLNSNLEWSSLVVKYS